MNKDLMNYIPVLLPLFWVVVSILISRISGWADLAERYSFDGSFEGKRWRFVSARMRWKTGYNNVMTVGSNAKGLYLAMFLLFRPGHRPLFIPWHDITTRTVQGTLMTYTEIRFARVPSLFIRLPRRIAEKVLTVR